jgi:hypothetical protein
MVRPRICPLPSYPAQAHSSSSAEFGAHAYRDDVAATWDLTDPGVIRLPSGRLVRGRGLRRSLPTGSEPTFAVYLLGKATSRVALEESVGVRWPDLWLPTDRTQARTVLNAAWNRAATDRVEVAYKAGAFERERPLRVWPRSTEDPPNRPWHFVRQHYGAPVEVPWQRLSVTRFTPP